MNLNLFYVDIHNPFKIQSFDKNPFKQKVPYIYILVKRLCAQVEEFYSTVLNLSLQPNVM